MTADPILVSNWSLDFTSWTRQLWQLFQSRGKLQRPLYSGLDLGRQGLQWQISLLQSAQWANQPWVLLGTLLQVPPRQLSSRMSQDRTSSSRYVDLTLSGVLKLKAKDWWCGMILNGRGAYGAGFVAFDSWFGDLSGECPTSTPEATFMLFSFCVFQYLVAKVWIYGVASLVM